MKNRELKRWIVEWLDHGGIPRMKKFETRKEAFDYEDKLWDVDAIDAETFHVPPEHKLAHFIAMRRRLRMLERPTAG